MAISANPLYPTGTSFTDCIKGERELREEAEAGLRSRIAIIEDRLFIIDAGNVQLDIAYPDLVKAYKKFKKEESKMKTFEALKNSA